MKGRGNVTVVGGTTLNTTGPEGSWVSETTWPGSGGGRGPRGHAGNRRTVRLRGAVIARTWLGLGLAERHLRYA